MCPLLRIEKVNVNSCHCVAINTASLTGSLLFSISLVLPFTHRESPKVYTVQQFLDIFDALAILTSDGDCDVIQWDHYDGRDRAIVKNGPVISCRICFLAKRSQKNDTQTISTKCVSQTPNDKIGWQNFY